MSSSSSERGSEPDALPQAKKQKPDLNEIKDRYGISDDDVIMGMNGRPGILHNQGGPYASLVEKRRKDYQESTSNTEKQRIASEVISEVAKRGGKFWRREDDGEWKVCSMRGEEKERKLLMDFVMQRLRRPGQAPMDQPLFLCPPQPPQEYFPPQPPHQYFRYPMMENALLGPYIQQYEIRLQNLERASALQKQENAALRGEIAALKGENAALRGELAALKGTPV